MRIIGLHNQYHLVKEGSEVYTFLSEGERSILKAVLYQPMMDYDNSTIFNLAFGDAIPGTSTILDNVDSNNGDMYKVFYTVLASALRFFEDHPDDLLYVTGTDKRRTRIYLRFINQYYDELKESYGFFGCYTYDQVIEITDDYIKNSPYDGVIVYQLL